MYINKLTLDNFRNFKNKTVLNLENSVNVFVGDNAQGKTNLLEAIHFLALGKSITNQKKDELIHWDKDYFYITCTYYNSKSNKIEVGYNQDNRKIIKINSVEQKKYSSLLGNINVVIFSPDDLLLIKGSPSLRRNFLDQEISQLSPYYNNLMTNYKKVLFNRNKILKERPHHFMETLDIYDKQLAGFSEEILVKRIDIISKLKILARLTHRKLTDNTENLEIKYASFVDNLEQKIPELKVHIYELFKQSREKDLYTRQTNIGLHRDDIEFYVNGKDVKKYCSQGQQRTTILSLKLAEIEMFMSQRGTYPILLLDDVFSELDYKRRSFLLKAIKDKVQTFITTTEKEQELLGAFKVFNIKNGMIK
ncbi:DNA replication/repair protein RecF [Proteinivorax hydrogeniformans]|uniref:DNA replication and repair protein RecF n=1 Tax=Proteinivorax hydrogeniformans TaxID=1826727 RepID=A0AAU8HTD8_9FIRM